MKNIDSYLLSQYQKMSDFIQNWTGKDNFFLAKLCAALYSPSMVIENWGELYLRQGNVNGIMITIIIASMTTSIALFFVKTTEYMYRKQPLFRNSEAIAGSFLRSLLVLFQIFLNDFSGLSRFINFILGEHRPYGNLPLYQVFSDIGGFFESFFWISVWYFVACTPNPQKPSKFKKLFEKIRDRIQALGGYRLQPA